jgi:methionyl-tRNA formyltransferase
MSDTALRLVMVGTRDFAVPTFQRLLDEGLGVAALITQPERPQGRDQRLVPSRIKSIAIERGIPVEQPESINDPAYRESLRRLAPDLLVTAAYGQILSADVLAVPRLGGINLHGSILPAYRGAAPVARAIQQGESVTGVTVIRMTPRVDAGGMLAVATTPIGPDETAGEVEARLAEIGAPLVVDAIRDLAAGRAVAIPQDRSRVSRAPKLSKDEGRIDWSQPALRIHNHVRAMQPWPTAFTDWIAGDQSKRHRLVVHRTRVVADRHGEPGQVLAASGAELIVAAGTGAVALLSVQLPGKKPMPVDAFLRGHRDLAAGRFV